MKLDRLGRFTSMLVAVLSLSPLAAFGERVESGNQKSQTVSPAMQEAPRRAPSNATKLLKDQDHLGTAFAPLRIKTLPVAGPEDTLYFPYCSPRVLQFETTGGRGEVSVGSVYAVKKNFGSSGPPTISLGGPKWYLQRVEAGNVASAGNSAQPGYAPNVQPAPNQPAADTRFRISQSNGLTPRVFETAFGGGIESPRGEIRFNVQDGTGAQLNGRINYRYRVTAELLRPGVTIRDASDYEKSGNNFMEISARYRHCDADVPLELVDVKVTTDRGKRFDINVKKLRLPDVLLQRPYFDVVLYMKGRQASAPLRVTPAVQKYYTLNE